MSLKTSTDVGAYQALKMVLMQAPKLVAVGQKLSFYQAPKLVLFLGTLSMGVSLPELAIIEQQKRKGQMTNRRTEKTGEKQKSHRYKPGRSGNPKGRPKGARNKATLAAEVLLDDESEKLTRKAIELAMSGDTTALKLCLDRILPPRKERVTLLDLPPVKTSKDILKCLSTIINEVGKGNIDPHQAQLISGILETHRKTIETVDVETRLSILEEKVGNNN